MKKLLVVIDVQNDFVSGALGSPEAQAMLPYLKEKIQKYRAEGVEIIFSRDTHTDDYLTTQEGKNLPVPHCIVGTKGHELAVDSGGSMVVDKPTFGSLALADLIASRAQNVDEIEICGICTDICVVSNALILKARLPEIKLTVDSKACAGVTKESHQAALTTMQMCQIKIT